MMGFHNWHTTEVRHIVSFFFIHKPCVKRLKHMSEEYNHVYGLNVVIDNHLQTRLRRSTS